MKASRAPVRATADEWSTWTQAEKDAFNKREEQRIRACQSEDDEELLAFVDAAGPSGYRLKDHDPNDKTEFAIRMLLAAQRLSSNPNKFKPLMPLVEREPFVMVRRKREW